MDIRQLEYFITIAENGFNLTKAAKALNISQPALSKLIKNFERVEGIKLFTYNKGKLTGLTTAGEKFIHKGISIKKMYNEMYQELREANRCLRGTVTIGIPPVILTVLFGELIPEFIINNPDIKLNIVELGAYELKKKLLLNEIDGAILIDPVNLQNMKTTLIMSDSVSIFMNENHSLAKKKGALSLKEIHREKLMILNDSFMLTHQIRRRFDMENLHPNIFFQSGSWDLLINMCNKTNGISILPTPIGDFYSESIVLKPFKPNFDWKVVFCRNINTVKDKHLLEYVEEYFINFFNNKEQK